MIDYIDAAIADPRTYADQSRLHGLFSGLRKEDPVHWTEPDGYRPFWAITRHADVMEVERQSSVFMSAPRTALRSIEEEERIRKVTGSVQVARTLIQMDQPDHRVYRALTQAWFMPAKLRSLEASLAGLGSQFIERIMRHNGTCDFVRDVAAWYPLRVIMLMLGVPEEDEMLMLKLTQQHFASSESSKDQAGSAGAGGTAAREIFAYFNELTKRRRKDPRDDIISLLADAKVDGKPISDFDRNSYYFILAIAGHDTTTSSISGTMLALLENPGEFAKLRADASLLRTAIDEGIRWTSPVRHFFRTAAQDYTLAGRRIEAGQSLMLCYPSANRDEEAFEAPSEFRVDRSPNPHLAFGYGAHLCLGQHLAKLEMYMLFSRLLPQLEDVALAGEPQWLPVNFVGGLKSLPLSYRIRAAEQV